MSMPEEFSLWVPYTFDDFLWGSQGREHVGRDSLKHKTQDTVKDLVVFE
jgi:hypothetical protein